MYEFVYVEHTRNYENLQRHFRKYVSMPVDMRCVSVFDGILYCCINLNRCECESSLNSIYFTVSAEWFGLP